MEIGIPEFDPKKCLSQRDRKKLMAVARSNAKSAGPRERKTAVRNYFFIHLGLGTGLRVMEIAALNCGDLFLNNRIPFLVIRKGKGGKRRQVFFNNSLRKHCREYLAWKKFIGESTESEEPLLLSKTTGGHLTTRALQKAFKRCAHRADLASHYSIHCLRHTYASLLYIASDKDVLMVKEQLGHTRIETTENYLSVLMQEMEKALNRLDI